MVNTSRPPERSRSVAQPAAAACSPAPSVAAPPAHLSTSWVRLNQLAGEMGIDPRTLKKHLAGQPFVERLGSHVTLVDRRAFEAWLQSHRG